MFDDPSPITTRFVSAPDDAGKATAAAFVAGMVQGMLASAGFSATVRSFPENKRPLDDSTLFAVVLDEPVA